MFWPNHFEYIHKVCAKSPTFLVYWIQIITFEYFNYSCNSESISKWKSVFLRFWTNLSKLAPRNTSSTPDGYSTRTSSSCCKITSWKYDYSDNFNKKILRRLRKKKKVLQYSSQYDYNWLSFLRASYFSRILITYLIFF